MKLSEAIRAGAGIRPQTKYRYFKDDSSCVLGAIAEGAGLVSYSDRDGIDVLTEIRREFPILQQNYFHPDVLEGLTIDMCNVLIELNDNEGLTREEIADWVEKEVEN